MIASCWPGLGWLVATCRVGGGRSETVLQITEHLPFPNFSFYKILPESLLLVLCFQYSPPAPHGCLTITFFASLAKRVLREPLYLHPHHTRASVGGHLMCTRYEIQLVYEYHKSRFASVRKLIIKHS